MSAFIRQAYFKVAVNLNFFRKSLSLPDALNYLSRLKLEFHPVDCISSGASYVIHLHTHPGGLIRPDVFYVFPWMLPVGCRLKGT